MAGGDAAHSLLTVGDLFTREPPQFGMRGDSYLWQELRERFAETPVPDSVWTLRTQLEAAWETAVGQRLTNSSTPVHLARLDPGHGMSAGQVVPEWWHNTGLILIIDRYNGAIQGG
jgi:hypothetical protein